MQSSEAVADLKHVQVQAGIMLADAGVGHVLEAIARTQLLVDATTQAHVTGKLKRHPEIHPRKFIFAQNGWAGCQPQTSKGSLPCPLQKVGPKVPTKPSSPRRRRAPAERSSLVCRYQPESDCQRQCRLWVANTSRCQKLSSQLVAENPVRNPTAPQSASSAQLRWEAAATNPKTNQIIFIPLIPE